MKTTKLVIGIISMVLFLIIAFQSCAAGIGNALAENGESSGTAGFLLAICMLVAGIVSVAAKKSVGATITAAVFYACGGILAFANAGSFGDLKIWGTLSIVFAALYAFFAFRMKKEEKNTDNQ